MSSVSGIKAGRAFISLGAEDSELRAVLKRTETRLNATAKTIRTIGASMVAAGGAMAGGLLAAATSAGKLGDHLNDLNAKTSIGVESLAGLDIAASTSGSSLDALSGDIYKMNRVIGEAAGGSKSAADALASLGLTLADLQGLSPDKQFGIFADRIAAIPDPAGRAAAATKIFGRASGDLMPILMQGSRGLKEFQAQADALGVTLAYKTASGVGEFDDALARTRKQIEAVKVTIGAAIAQALLPYQSQIAETLKSTIEWVTQNNELIVSIGKTAVQVTIAGGALLGLSSALNLVAKSIAAVSLASKALAASPLFTLSAALALLVPAMLLYAATTEATSYDIGKAAQDATAAQDKARATDLARVDSLGKLAGAGKLNDVQMKQAGNLIANLESKYGALGITINQTTKEIEGMAGALGKVEKSMKQRAIEDVEKEMKSIQAQINKVADDFSEANDDFYDGMGVDFFRGMFNGKENQLEEASRASNATGKLINRLQDANERRKKLLSESDDAGLLTNGQQAEPTFDTSGIVTSIENVGDAAVESGSKVSRWADLLRMAQEMFRKQKAGEEFLLDLSVSHARATGNDVFADSLETVREFREALDGLQSHPFLTDAQKKWAGATALDAAEANLERIREGLSEVNLRTFSAGVFNSNAISSLNRAGNSGKSFEANQKKQISLLEESRNWLRTIAQKEGLIFGP